MIVLSSCAVKKIETEKLVMQPLVNTQWLNLHKENKDLLVIDATVFVNMDENGDFINSSGLQNYQQEHIPNAVFADLISNLSRADEQFDFVMPTQEQFEKEIVKLGVGDESIIVIYSAASHVWATRLWWMFKWAGIDQVVILDGGLNAWKRQGHKVSNQPSAIVEKKLNLQFKKHVIANTLEVSQIQNKNHEGQLIDALPTAHFNGEFSLYSRPGHIPGAINIPSSMMVDESGFFKPLGELNKLFLMEKNERIVSYCGGGVAASSVAFTLYRLGYTDVAVYMDSLQKWALQPDKPLIVKE